MRVFIGSDHRGFELKNNIIDYLHEKNIRTEDAGNYTCDKEDDYVDYAQNVSRAILQNPEENLGIVICGSGVGVSIACNRFKGIRCGLGFSEEQIKHGRERDHINVLALAADLFDLDQIKKFVDVFVQTQPTHEERDLRRLTKLETTTE